jgi:hypothetical protein
MKNLRLECLLLLLLAFAAGCAVSPSTPSPAPAQVVFYAGTVTVTSPDGRLPFNKTEAVLKREIATDRNLILETFTQPGHAPSMPPQTVVTRLQRRGRSLVFNTVDDQQQWRGSVTFDAPSLASWTYAQQARDNSAITGSGRLIEQGISVSRTFAGSRARLVTEELRVVSQAEYERVLASFQPPKGAE